MLLDAVTQIPQFWELRASLSCLGVTYRRAGVVLIKSSAEDSPPFFLVPGVLPPIPPTGEGHLSPGLAPCAAARVQAPAWAVPSPCTHTHATGMCRPRLHSSTSSPVMVR